MGAVESIEKLRGRSVGVSFGHEPFNGYEQRLIRWGCSKCRFFEKRVFRSGLLSDELDAYIICRFGGGLVDLIGEATACPKRCRPELHVSKSGSGRLHLGCAERKAAEAPREPSTARRTRPAVPLHPRNSELPSFLPLPGFRDHSVK